MRRASSVTQISPSCVIVSVGSQAAIRCPSLDALIARYVDEALDVPVLEGVDYALLERRVWAALHLYETDRGRAMLAHEFGRDAALTPRPTRRDPGVKTWE